MKSFYKVIFIILLLFNVIGIYLFENDYDLFGVIDYEDFLSMFNIAIFIILSVTTKKYKAPKISYRKWIIFFIIMFP